MLVLSDEAIVRFILQYFIPFVRIGAMFMVMPVFGSRTVPPRVRLVSAILVSVAVVPILPPIPVVKGLSLELVLIVFREMAIGLAVGFIFQLTFQVFVLSGQFIAMKMGLGFAAMNDPTTGVQTTVLSQFFLMLVTLVFVVIDGHLVLIEMLVNSFYTLPPGGEGMPAQSFLAVVNMGSWMFMSALVFALPVLTSLLIVNIAFGIMSRAAPQLNIFAVGFPFTLLCGLLLVYIGLANFETSFNRVMQESIAFVSNMLLAP